ncbi:MAG TPA: hypothetical protein VMD56_04345 [Steroidobacteraceae bacterium]|nr:hypothetical protein [Steroidobacteraceae bacterium]
MAQAPVRSGLLKLARLYVDIALWRRGPQDLPTVGILLPLTIGAYVLISVGCGEALPALRDGWVPLVLADTAFIALWYWLLLALARRRARYLQTAAALFGLQTVLAAPSIVSEWLLERFAHDASWLAVAYVGALAVFVWTVAAIGHVLRSALERSLGLCVVLALLQMLAEELVLLPLFEPHH